jgi:transposase InsO family protein
MRILKLRAARGWSAAQTAERFLVTVDTIASWIRRVDEGGERALVRLEEPVNKFPAFVGQIVRSLKLICPTLGKVRIAQMFARAGLHISASTVRRMLKQRPTRDELAAEEPVVVTGRIVTAKRPNHIWHVDLTTVPTGAGFWVPWLPYSKLLRWPFCWWVALVIDHASRLVVGFAVFDRRPTGAQVRAFLDRAIKKTGQYPKYVIADKGREFFWAANATWKTKR